MADSWFAVNRPQVQRNRTTMPPGTLANPSTPTDFGGGIVEQQQRQITDARNAGAPAGFDAKKWQNDTLGTTHKYVGGRILKAGGSIDDVLRDPQFKGWTKVSDDKIKGPGGSTYDVYKGFSENGTEDVQWTAVSGPAWDKNGIPGVNSAGVNTAAIQGLKNDGIRGNYAAAAAGGTLANPAGTQPGGGSTADFTVKPWDQTFTAPTQQEAQNDQGFQFTLARGKEALERSAAARGTLLTTGTLKDLGQFSQDAGSQQYDKVYGRRMGEYQNKYNEFTGNESARFGAHQANFGNNLAVNKNQFSQGLATNQNAFNQQFSLANLGYRAASDTGQNAGNYADAAGNLYTEQGNVDAAGQMYGSQAWQRGIGSLADLGGYYAGLYQNRQPQQPGPWAGGYQY